jgi:surface protein
LQSLDLSSWDTSKVTDLTYCFQGCSALQSLDLSSWDTSKVTDLTYCFQGCSALQSLDLSSWDTSKVTSLFHCFEGCSALQDLTMNDFSSMIDLTYAFSGGSGSSSVTKLKLPELREGNNLKKMYCTWYNNRNLQKLDLSKFNTKNVTNYAWVFSICTALEWLDISGFDLTSATNVNSFFELNQNLKHLVLGEGFGKIKQEATFDMSSFASLDEESKVSFMSLYDRKANGLPNVTLKLKTSYGFSEEQIQSLTNKGYTINLV